MSRVAPCALVLMLSALPLGAQVHLADHADREAFQSWFVLLADAQFYRPTPDVNDCAGLVRHAAREALRPHTPEWHRQAALPLVPAIPDVRVRPPAGAGGLALFRVGDKVYAEFADAKTIVELNARWLGRDVRALRPGDLLHFRQERQRTPDHLMVFVGDSAFESGGRDWIVYHTGPTDTGPGEVRKVRLSDLMQHPAPRWRPVSHNPAFVGVFRLAWL
ncbi:MAG: DUF1175 family protein [Acidobacteriota bacterium]